jgi:hypothetical protein
VLVLPRALSAAGPAGEAVAARSRGGVDATAAGTTPRRALTTLVEAIAVLALYSGLTLWWLWPLPTAWTDHSAYRGGVAVVFADYSFLTWTLAWDVHALLHDPLRVFHANAFYPTPLVLALSDHLFGLVPIFAPTYLLTGNPVLASNLTLFASFPLGAAAAYALARRWLAPAPALVCGLIYAFYPARLEGIVHFHQLSVQYIPLLFLFAERWLDDGRARDLVGLAVFFALQTLTSFYIAYAVVLGLGAYLPVALWHRRRSLDRRRFLGLAACLLIASLPVALTGIPYLKLRALGLVPSYGSADAPIAMGLIPYFGTRRALSILLQDGVPTVGYALAAVALLPPWRDRRWPTALGVLLAAAGVFLSFGPAIQTAWGEVWSPYAVLMRVVPGLSAVRLPSRFHVVSQIGFALLAAIGVARLAAFAPRRAVRVAAPALSAVAVALILWRYSALPAPPLNEELAPDRVPPVYAWLAAHGGGRPMLEIPGVVIKEATRRMLLSTYHHLPIVDGYSSYWPDSPQVVHRLAAGLPADDALQRLVDHVDIGWVLVHLGSLSQAQRERWRPPYPDGLTAVDAPVGPDELLLRVDRAPREDRRARLLDTSRTIQGTPLRPIEGPCPGEIRIVVPPPDPWPAGRTATIAVEVVNASDAPLPATSIFHRHVVEGRAQLARGARDRRSSDRFTFADDIPAHGSVKAYVNVQAPMLAGPQVLRLWLAQDGRPLDECGIPTLELPVNVQPAQ